MAMKRRLFHIPEDQIERLQVVATQRHVSIGELVRRFIDQGLARLDHREQETESALFADLQAQIDEVREEITTLRIYITERHL